MIKRRALGGLTLAGLGLAAAARAEAYPVRPIRVISPFPPGGGTDFLSRAISSRLAEANGWTVVVENRAGANGTIGLAEAALRPPTGYDLVLGQQDNLVLAPNFTRVTFDSVKDFTPIAFAGTSPLVLLVSSKSPYQSFADLMTAAREAKGTVTFGSSGTGSSSHIISALLTRRAGIELQHVPYRGSNPAIVDLLGGHVGAVGSSIASAMSSIKSGAARPLAVSGLRRSPSLPDTPTLKELGIDVNVTAWWGMLGPAGMPNPIVAQLNHAINAVLAKPDAIQLLGEQGIEVSATTPQEFAQFLQRDVTTWRDTIAELGIRLD